MNGPSAGDGVARGALRLRRGPAQRLQRAAGDPEVRMRWLEGVGFRCEAFPWKERFVGFDWLYVWARASSRSPCVSEDTRSLGIAAGRLGL